MEPIPFEIAHCSSFEQDYQPDNLTGEISEKSRGWQTKKYPEYPQDLILQFKAGLCRIFKIEILSHHYKIASQIEFYAGTMKEQEQDSTYIQFNRLGFVSLNDNNRFQDRELKSVKVQADCEYVRLVVKGCYENRLNVYKQVGFLALSIMGHSVSSIEQIGPLSYKQPTQPKPSRSPVLPSVTDDFNLEHWIQVIQNAEEEAAQDEDFKEAKIYKELGDRLTGLWRFLINLESDKQQAILTKDYDEAEKIKADMIQVRCTVESLLKQSGIQITREGDILPYEGSDHSYHSEEEEDDMLENGIPDLHTISNTPSKLNNTSQQKERHPDQLLDEAIANWTSFDALSINNISNEVTSSPSLLSARIPNQPSTKEKSVPAEQPKTQEDPELLPEPLTLDDMESCQLAIQKFGQELVACIMSVKIKCRQHGLDQLAQLIEQQSQFDLEFIQASILMIQEAIVDSREAIFNQAIRSWKSLYELCRQQMATLDDDYQLRQITSAVEKFFSRVLMRTSDSNPGIKSSATKTVLDLIEFDKNLITLCFKDRMIRNLKDAKARLELITLIIKKSLVKEWASDPTFLRQQTMKFIVSYLKNHPHADVRQSTWDLLVLVAQHQQKEADFKAICAFLENDTIKLLQQEFRKNEKKTKSSTSTTVKELRALAVKSNSGTTAKKSSHVAKAKPTGDKRNTTTNTKKTKTKTQSKPLIEDEEEEKTNVCIFCDKIDDAFNEDTLISHYYNSCPVLTNCPMCQIILEVSTLKEHLELDCEKKHLVKQCNQCKTSIPVEQWLQHTLKKTCTATADGQSRCPFCQLDMTKSNEKGWKSHLINKCPKNPRRTQK